MAELVTTFDLPTEPDEFGLVLPPPDLRRFDFSGLDYVTARRAGLEYLRTYYHDDFNDFYPNNAVVMLLEVFSSAVAKLSLRGDLLAGEALYGSAKTEEAVAAHLALIGQRFRRQTPATVDVEVTVDRPAFTDVEIDAGTVLAAVGADGQEVAYEVYRTPGDFTSRVVIPAGKRGVIAYGLEGRTAAPVTFISDGQGGQRLTINEPRMLEAPITVTVATGEVSEDWPVVYDPLERYGPQDKVVEVSFLGDSVIFRFGDDVNGTALASNQRAAISYRVGGGKRGRIGVGQLDVIRSAVPRPPANATVSVRFRNVSASVGGYDRETVEQAKRRAPRDFALQRSVVTAADYAQIASFFSHPAFGTVAKAVASVRTDINANLVELHVLAEAADGMPVAASAGLKEALRTRFEQLNVLTDTLQVIDGTVLPVDLDVNVIVSRSADASVVRERVASALNAYFDLANWEMGKGLYKSNLIEAIEAVDGVRHVDLFKPANNILPTGNLAVAGVTDAVGMNQLIVKGNWVVNHYYDRA